MKSPESSSPAEAIQRTEKHLVAAVDDMRRRLKLTRETNELVDEIKKAMEARVQLSGSMVFQTFDDPFDQSAAKEFHELTVSQVLYDRSSRNAFNQSAAKEFPEIRREFGNAIQDHVVVKERRRVSAKKTRRIAENAWKEDPCADRRIKAEMEGSTKRGMRSVFKGRPEVYNADVVWAFADAIARAAGRQKFSIGHRGDVTITANSKGGGPMLRVLVAALQWANAFNEVALPDVKPESILAIIKKRALTNSTD